jgi:hypothetical protein
MARGESCWCRSQPGQVTGTQRVARQKHAGSPFVTIDEGLGIIYYRLRYTPLSEMMNFERQTNARSEAGFSGWGGAPSIPADQLYDTTPEGSKAT